MSIVLKTDFGAGEYVIPQQAASQDLQVFIDKYEKHYLLRLMGSVLYNLFNDDLTGNPSIPQATRFTDIFDPFNNDDDNILRISDGIKVMLIQFTYYHYIKEQQTINTIGGTKSLKSNVSNDASFQGNIQKAYNDAIQNHREIQRVLVDESATYPEENGIFLPFSSGI